MKYLLSYGIVHYMGRSWGQAIYGMAVVGIKVAQLNVLRTRITAKNFINDFQIPAQSANIRVGKSHIWGALPSLPPFTPMALLFSKLTSLNTRNTTYWSSVLFTSINNLQVVSTRTGIYTYLLCQGHS